MHNGICYAQNFSWIQFSKRKPLVYVYGLNPPLRCRMYSLIKSGSLYLKKNLYIKKTAAIQTFYSSEFLMNHKESLKSFKVLHVWISNLYLTLCHCHWPNKVEAIRYILCSFYSSSSTDAPFLSFSHYENEKKIHFRYKDPTHPTLTRLYIEFLLLGSL